MTNRVRTDLYLYALVNNMDLEIKLLSLNAESLIKGGAFASQKEVDYCIKQLQEKRDRIAALRADSDKLDTLKAPTLTSTDHTELVNSSSEVDTSIMRLAQHIDRDNLPDAPCDAKTTGIGIPVTASPSALYATSQTRKVAALNTGTAPDYHDQTTSARQVSTEMRLTNVRDSLPSFPHCEIDGHPYDGE